ncbi:MAG TPA: hypothetical protein PK299_10615 [Anaerolineales bacterium]|nr:hypothetical protein [Anaerolineales bacterium]
MAKWNACRANQGLATATVITPPPVAPPHPANTPQHCTIFHHQQTFG